MAPKQRSASPGATPKSTADEVRHRGAPTQSKDAKDAGAGPPKEAKGSGDASKLPTAGRHMFRQESVYALQPDVRWLQPSLAFPLYAATLVSTMALCLLWTPSFRMLRLQYTLVGMGLLLYRVHYYARKEWMLYFIDLCFVNSILLIWSLWFCESGGCSQDWLLAVYIIAQGPVAGATFPLQTPLTLHHPEAFESFFLHASPMWISYAVRWRWAESLGPIPSVWSLLSAGLLRLYLPWSTIYLVFLLLQPFLPDRIAGLETLMDGFIFPASTTKTRLAGKRQEYRSYAFNVVKATLLHFVLSTSGTLAAALAYQYHEVQIAWILCVLAGCISSGARFYYQSAHPESVPPGVLRGFRNMGLAWAIVLPTFLHSAGYISFR